LEDAVKIGKVINTVGLKGEIKVYPDMDYFDQIERVYIDNQEYQIEKVRTQKNVVVLKLQDIDNIDAAEKLRDKDIMLKLEDRPKPPDGKYYVGDLIGMEVVTDDGKVLGKIDGVFNTGANDIYEVGEILLPVIDEVIKEVDTDNRKIIVHLLKGLVDEV